MLVVAIVLFLAACTGRKKDENASAIPVQDTLGLAEYQKWKMENELRERMEAEDREREAQNVVAAPVRKTSSARSSSSRSSGTYRSSGSRSGSSSGSQGTASYPAQAPVRQRKGISHTAKGAIVGGVSGAVIGAVANKKNRVGGGVVGGVIGAATGAGVGAIVDKRQRERGY